MTKKRRGRPGPAITIGIPTALAAFAGAWGYSYFKDTDARRPHSAEPAAPVVAAAPAEPTTFEVAADPWSGYSTFRKEPRFAAALARDQITLRYLDDEKYYDQNERLRALAAGEIDLALTTLDAFLQFGAQHLQAGQYPGTIIFGVDESA